MTKQETINKAMLYVGDTSELPDSEFEDLYDKVLGKIYANRPWEFSKTTASLTQSISLPYVALPEDFLYPVANYDYAGSNTYAEGATIFVGTNNNPITLIPFSQRNRYRNATNKAYVDTKNTLLYFTAQPTAANAFEFDYHAAAPTLALGDSPDFPATYHPIIYHGMVADDFLIQLFDKAKSYRDENLAEYRKYLSDMASWDFNLKNMGGYGYGA